MDRPVRHTRESRRLINRRQQGDLGEASAIEWLTRMGAGVWIPLGHSPDADLVAEVDARLFRIQVKTTTFKRPTLDGQDRWAVALATNGGNQSWSGVSKRFDPARCDFLFVLAGDGRRWFIPTSAVEGHRGINLGGARYSEFEVESVASIMNSIYADQGDGHNKIEDPRRGSADVGESGETVNLVPRVLSGFESHLPHASVMSLPGLPADTDPEPGRIEAPARPPTKFERTRISVRHQITIPSVPFHQAGLQVGDRLRAFADGEGRVVLERLD
jgi:hypothetical protein